MSSDEGVCLMVCELNVCVNVFSSSAFRADHAFESLGRGRCKGVFLLDVGYVWGYRFSGLMFKHLLDMTSTVV